MKSTMQVIVDDTLKVNPYEALRESELLEKLEKSREHATQGIYKDADEISLDIRTTYGL